VEESGSDIVFLRRVEPGSADKSYGIEVARLAGLPAAVVERARAILARHEKSEGQFTQDLAHDRANEAARAAPGAAPEPQQAAFTAIDQPVLDALRNADLDHLTPLEALNLLAALQKQLA
jgi:DNA mismatch repair protein MutS